MLPWLIGIAVLVFVALVVIVAILSYMVGGLKVSVADWERIVDAMKREFEAAMVAAQRTNDEKLARVRAENINTRQRWLLTGMQLLTAKNWIQLMIPVMREAQLCIPIPPNIEEIPMRDESIHYEEIERMMEYRLDDLIKEATDANAALSNATN